MVNGADDVYVERKGRITVLVRRPERTKSGARAAIRDAALRAAPGLDGTRVRIDVVREGSQGDAVSVAVAYEATVATPLAGWLLPAAVELRASATMRQEVP